MLAKIVHKRLHSPGRQTFLRPSDRIIYFFDSSRHNHYIQAMDSSSSEPYFTNGWVTNALSLTQAECQSTYDQAVEKSQAYGKTRYKNIPVSILLPSCSFPKSRLRG